MRDFKTVLRTAMPQIRDELSGLLLLSHEVGAAYTAPERSRIEIEIGQAVERIRKCLDEIQETPDA